MQSKIGFAKKTLNISWGVKTKRVRQIGRHNIRSKITRTLTAFKPVEGNRVGKCRCCGACCELVFRCPFLKYKDKKAVCIINGFKPPVCKKYPRTADEHVTKDVCGFQFR